MLAPLDAKEDARQNLLRGGGEIGPPDEVLREIWREQGFDGLPSVTDASGVDDVIAQGGVELWRGIRGSAAVEQAEEFRSGEAFAGLGVNGSGTYTGVRRSTGERYATTNTGAPGGSLLRMALRPGARVIERSELDKLISEYTIANRPSGPRPWETPRTGRGLTVDPGRAAAALGYDAIYVDYSTPAKAGNLWRYAEPDADASHYVVLNRTALVVQDTDPRIG